jgi:hypothetical protein
MLVSARVLAVVVALFGATGCPGETVDDDDGGADSSGPRVDLPPMRPGAVVLHAAHQGYGDPDPTLDALDASVDGDRVVVLTLRPAMHASLQISEDGGATFRVLAIPDDPQRYTARAVYAAHGKVFVISSAALMREIDLTTGVAGPPIAMPTTDPPRFHRDADAIAGFQIASGQIEWARFEAVTGALQRVVRPLREDEACLNDRQDGRVSVTHDGVRFTTLCAERYARCLVTFDGAVGGATTRACLPLADWPIGAHIAHTIVARGDGVYLLYSAAGRLVARRFAETPPSLGAPIDLGPGLLGPFARIGEDAHGGLIRALDASGAVRFVAWPEGRDPHTLPLPESVCLAPAACSIGFATQTQYRTLKLALPLDGTLDRWLAVYGFGWDGLPASYYVVAHALASGDAGPPFVPPPATSEDRGPPPPEAPAESPLERVCARAVGCFPTFGIEDCVDYWLTARGPTRSEDDAYQAFVATGPACSDFVGTFPQVALRTESCQALCDGDAAFFGCAPEPLGAGAICDSGTCLIGADGGASCGAADGAVCGTCVDGGAVQCRYGHFEGVMDCAARGLTCVLAPATGAVCASGARCLRNHCGPDGLEICLGSADTSSVVATIDCERVGLLCDTGFTLGATGHCGTALRAYATCVTGPGSRCDGDALLYCVGDQQRFIDCAALGQVCVAHATVTQSEAHCADAPRF